MNRTNLVRIIAVTLMVSVIAFFARPALAAPQNRITTKYDPNAAFSVTIANGSIASLWEIVGLESLMSSEAASSIVLQATPQSPLAAIMVRLPGGTVAPLQEVVGLE